MRLWGLEEVPELTIIPPLQPPPDTAGLDPMGTAHTTPAPTGDELVEKKMRYLEQEPLTHLPFQNMLYKGVMYTRVKGETKFREGRTEIPRDQVKYYVPIIVDLRIEQVKKYIDSLKPVLESTDSSEVFNTWLEKRQFEEMVRRRIPYVLRTVTEFPSYLTGGEDERKPQIPEDPKSPANAELFFDGFETAWPGPWTVEDVNSASGWDYWGDVEGNAYSGSWSVFCADEGAHAPGFYDNNMVACMTLTHDMVDLTGSTNEQLSFRVKYDTEPGYDFFKVWISTNGGNLYVLQGVWHGFSNGWTLQNLPIPAGNTFSVKFEFTSDDIVTASGVFLDDIRVTGTLLPTVNLTSDWPLSWSGSLVVSNTAGTNTNTPLWGYDNGYVDWAITNLGGGTNQAFRVGLYRDGISGPVMTWTINGLGGFQATNRQDYVMNLATGAYTLRVKIDDLNQIAETNESDNEIWGIFNWQAPQISVSGQVTHWKMSPPVTSGNPCGELLLELRDDDGGTSEVLATTRTSSTGHYSFANITNRELNGDGGRQDIFLRAVADNPATVVRPDFGVPAYALSSTVLYSIANGSLTVNFGIQPSVSGYFYVAEAIRFARSKWQSYRSGNPLPVAQTKLMGVLVAVVTCKL